MLSETNRPNYMAELDAWLTEQVFTPLGKAWLAFSQAQAGPNAMDARSRIDEVQDTVKKLIREKVLESFKNGKNATGRFASSRRDYRR